MSTTVRSPHVFRPAAVVMTALGAAALGVMLPGTAHAHVGLSADTTAAGSSTVLTLAVPHGCDGSPTTKISVRVPRGIDVVTPTVNPGWTVRKAQQKLDAPATAPDGDRLTSRVAEVVWTAKRPLPDGYRDTLSLQVVLPPEAAGHDLAFPTLQTCSRGEVAWTQVPAAGQDHDDLDHPAPTLLVTAAEQEGHAGHGESEEREATKVEADLQTGTPTAAGAAWTGPAGLVLGALGLLAGLAALVTGRRAALRAGRS